MIDATDAITVDDSTADAPIVHLFFQESECIECQRALSVEAYRTRKYRRYIAAEGITLTVWLLVIHVKEVAGRQLKLI